MRRTKRKKNIRLRVKNLIEKYNTTSPHKLCEKLNVQILYDDLGELKGYFTNLLGNKMIILNEKLDEVSEEIVLSHELGHAYLHNRREARIMYKLHHSYSMEKENEANDFMFELLSYRMQDTPYEVLKNCYLGVELLEKLKNKKY